jgi:hypothetical protein
MASCEKARERQAQGAAGRLSTTSEPDPIPFAGYEISGLDVITVQEKGQPIAKGNCDLGRNRQKGEFVSSLVTAKFVKRRFDRINDFLPVRAHANHRSVRAMEKEPLPSPS